MDLLFLTCDPHSSNELLLNFFFFFWMLRCKKQEKGGEMQSSVQFYEYWQLVFFFLEHPIDFAV